MANYTARANVASASAVTLPEGSNYIVVTGTTTITSLSTRPAGEIIVLRFSGALTLTHNATSLILQNAANYLTVAGDTLAFVSEGSGNWREAARDYATGKVAFPATAVATTDVNTLDDYEEGTWTPTITFGGAAAGLTYSAQTGTYMKIGNRVLINCNITLSAKGTSTGAAKVASLPFTVGAVYAVTLGALSAITFTGHPSGLCTAGASTVDLYETTDAGVRTTLVETDFADTSDMFLAAAYSV